MIHYTLTTDHSRESPREEVGDEAIKAVWPLLTPNDEHVIPGIDGYKCGVRIQDSALLATVNDAANRPLVSFGVATDAAAAWPIWQSLMGLYRELQRKLGKKAIAKQPAKTPWCAAVVIFASPEEAAWIADFERCVAWAWMRKNGEEKLLRDALGESP